MAVGNDDGQLEIGDLRWGLHQLIMVDYSDKV